MLRTNKGLREFFWIGFDMGNSSHALLISTVGFALYFRQVLFAQHPKGDFLWGILTAFVLAMSAIASPFVSSWLSYVQKRGRGLLTITLVCVVASALLAVPLAGTPYMAVLLYVISAISYYVALPIYNSFLPDYCPVSLQKTSAKGWAWGYVGGILAVLACLLLGFLDQPINYHGLFIVAALFNLALSLPLLISSLYLDNNIEASEHRWRIRQVLKVVHNNSQVLPLLFVYWLIGEVGTIVVYFTAIFLAVYRGFSVSTILILTLVVQGGAFFSTRLIGQFTHKFGGKRLLYMVVTIWILVPVLLWAVSKGVSYWFALIAVSLVLGAYHSLIRGEIGEVVSSLDDRGQKGSIWGLLEVSGRVSQILGPFVVGIVAFFTSLNNAILVAAVFPLAALLILGKYQWKGE